jgi:phage-related tail fiber protein
MRNITSILLLGLLTINLSQAAGVPVGFTYEGKVLNSAGTAPLTSVISLKLDIYDPTGTCLLYEEQQSNIDLSQSNGLFAIQVGSVLGSTKRTVSDQNLSMANIFANNGQILAATTTGCSAGYTPAANDSRLLRVSVTTGTTTVTISPDLKINAIPNALVAETLQGQTLTQVMEPSGTIIAFAGAACPSGYLLANGTSQLVATYPNLANALLNSGSYIYGSADSAHFNLPDFRGVFIRGLDNGAGIDSGRTLGTYQGDLVGPHNHTISRNFHFNDSLGNSEPPLNNGTRFNHSSGTTVTDTSGSGIGGETRPKNYAVNYCIKN